MGTEVLHAQDCLPHRLRSVTVPVPSSSPFSPRRKPHAHNSSNPAPPNTSTNPRLSHLTANSVSRPCRKSPAKKKRATTPPPSSSPLLSGQVTILKRGESLDEKTSRSLLKENGSSRTGLLDLTVPLRKIRIPVPGIYAGSVCSVSPSPSALPLPTFPMRKDLQSCAAEAVSAAATEDLRRLLRLA